MTILIYILAFVVSFVVGIMTAWVPLTLMHSISGNHNAYWYPEPGNERRFFMVHNLGQCIAGLASTVVSLLSVLWVFGWFNSRPHIVFLIVRGILHVISVRCAAAHYMPRAQARGAALGVTIFFIYYVKSY